MDDLQNVTEIYPKIENFAVAPSVLLIAVMKLLPSQLQVLLCNSSYSVLLPVSLILFYFSQIDNQNADE